MYKSLTYIVKRIMNKFEILQTRNKFIPLNCVICCFDYNFFHVLKNIGDSNYTWISN